MYTAIDLFAGAGGLSLGFRQTGEFNIVAAAESNINAQDTYRANHPGVELLGDVRKITYSDVERKYGKIDIVIGGPPCQGFSNANRQKAQTISMNNGLVKEYVRAVRELQPDVFVMENVGMLRSEIHRFYYSYKDKDVIDQLGIEKRADNLELLAQKYRPWPATALVESLGNYTNYLWPEREYQAINLLFRQRNNTKKFQSAASKYKKCLLETAKRMAARDQIDDCAIHSEHEMGAVIAAYFNGKADKDAVIAAIEYPIMYQRMYMRYAELINNEIIIEKVVSQKSVCAKVFSFSVLDYVIKMLSSPPYSYHICPGLLNAASFGAPQRRERYIVIGTKRGTASLPKGTFTEQTYRTVRDANEDIEKVPTSVDVNASPQHLEPFAAPPGSLLEGLRDSNLLYNHVITNTKETAKKRFDALEPGQNFHDLPDNFKASYTDAKRTQNTIYLRLKYDEPSGTVVNVRKSMWEHPIINRALSIREAARLQTFPDSFRFTGTKDAQYQQVGNAVPPILARAIAEKVLHILHGVQDG